MPKLNAALVAQLTTQKLDVVTQLNAASKGITEIVDLAVCPKLQRLDLSKNEISALDGLALNHELRWLTAAGNAIASVDALKELHNLQVLNMGHNQLAGKVSVGRLRSLKALILNNNRITLVGGLDKCAALNTLVLSHNSIHTLGSWLTACGNLEKLSLSHNSLQELGASLRGCPSLTELRLNHNKLRALPPELSANRRLRILDCGGNPICSFDDIKVLAQLPHLRSLSFKGCPLAASPGYRDRLLGMLPGLEILDNQRLAERPMKAKTAGQTGPGQAQTADLAAAGVDAAAKAALGKPAAVQVREPASAALEARTAEEVARRRSQAAGAAKAGRGSGAQKQGEGHGALPATQGDNAAAAEGSQQAGKRGKKGQQAAGLQSGPRSKHACSSGEHALQQEQQTIGRDVEQQPGHGGAEDQPQKKRRRRHSKHGLSGLEATGSAKDAAVAAAVLPGSPTEHQQGGMSGLDPSQQQPERTAHHGKCEPDEPKSVKQPQQQVRQRKAAADKLPTSYSEPEDSEDDAVDASEVFRRPAQQKRDRRATGVVKIIDSKRHKAAGRQRGSGSAPPLGPTGAQALQALLQPAAAQATTLPAWD